MKKLLAILTVIFISLALFVTIRGKVKFNTSTDQSRSIAINNKITIPYYKTKDADKFFNTDTNGFWDSTDVSPGDLSGNFEVVYEKLEQYELDYVKDVIAAYDEVIRLLKLKGRITDDPNTEIPFWMLMGLPMTEASSFKADVGGISVPMLLKNYTGDNIKNYKSGDLFTKEGIDAVSPSGTYHGMFQMEKSTLQKYLNEMKSLSPKYPVNDIYSPIAQLYACAAFHLDPSGKFYYTYGKPEYDSLGLDKDDYWILSCLSHMWTATKVFPAQYKDIWYPFLQAMKSPAITDLAARNIKNLDKNYFMTTVVTYFGKSAGVKVGSPTFPSVPATSGGKPNYWSSYFNPDYSVQLLPDYFSVVPQYTINSNNTITDPTNSMFCIKYTAPAYPGGMNTSTFAGNGGGGFFLLDSSGKIVSAMPYGQIKHAILPQHLGKYLYKAFNVMVANNGNPPSGSTITQPTTRTVSPSMYYTEYAELEANYVPVVPASVLKVEDADKEKIEELMPDRMFINQSPEYYTGDFGESGWKGKYPMFAQSNSISSDIYTLTSFLHAKGLGQTPLPNSMVNTGLNEDGYITPQGLSKIITNPVSPYWLEQMGYDVKPIPIKDNNSLSYLFDEVSRGTAYIATFNSNKIKAITYNNDEIKTDINDTVIISKVVTINNKKYFEVVSSKYSNDELNNNRLLFSVDDAIKYNVITSAYTILGVSNNISKISYYVKNGLDDNNNFTLYKDAIIHSNKEDKTIDIYFDNLNKVTLKGTTDLEDGLYAQGSFVAKKIKLKDISINGEKGENIWY